MNEKTLGERRVRVDFNVANDSLVNEIKVTCAKLIDKCEEIKDKDPRLCAIAQSYIETACEKAVKLATA